MSLWDFFGGAADAVLDKRKRDMAAKLQQDLLKQQQSFQERLEMQRQDWDMHKLGVQAESERLKEMRHAEETAAERAAREAEFKENVRLQEAGLDIRRQEANASAGERKAAADARGLAQRIQLASAGLRLSDTGELERDPNFVAPQQFKSSDIVALAKAVSEVSNASVRSAAQNAMDVGDYAGAAAILAGKRSNNTTAPSLSTTDVGLWFNGQ